MDTGLISIFQRLTINIHSHGLDSKMQVSTMGNSDNPKGTWGEHRAVAVTAWDSGSPVLERLWEFCTVFPFTAFLVFSPDSSSHRGSAWGASPWVNSVQSLMTLRSGPYFLLLGPAHSVITQERSAKTIRFGLTKRSALKHNLQKYVSSKEAAAWSRI